MSQSITSWKHLDRTLTSHFLVIVKYSATWCGPCKRIAPAFEDLAIKHPNICFVTLDADTEDEGKTFAEWGGVTSLPTFRSYRNGALYQEIQSSVPNALEKLVQDVYV